MIRHFSLVSLVMAGSLLTDTAMAGTATTTFSVTATVVSSCIVSATSLVFGTYTGSANLDQTSTISITCSSGTTFSVSLNDGTNATGSTRRMTAGAGKFLIYEMYSDASRSTVWDATTPVGGIGTGAAQPLTLYGRIPSGQYSSAGSYSDTVQVTVTY